MVKSHTGYDFATLAGRQGARMLSYSQARRSSVEHLNPRPAKAGRLMAQWAVLKAKGKANVLAIVAEDSFSAN